jgi:hypothetical protein
LAVLEAVFDEADRYDGNSRSSSVIHELAIKVAPWLVRLCKDTEPFFCEATMGGMNRFLVVWGVCWLVGCGSFKAVATDLEPDKTDVRQKDLVSESPSSTLDLDPKLIEQSPVLQRWLKEIPDVASKIENDPSFRTRVRFGYSQFPSTDQAGGVNLGIEDLRIARSRVTVSADYNTSFNGKRNAWGANLQYYMRPLGKYINVAPVVGYRKLETRDTTIEGVNLGVKVLLVLSRGGGADISLTQTWVSPFSSEQTGLTTLSFGYALTHNLRLSTDLQKQNSPIRKDSRVGIGLEWMP